MHDLADSIYNVIQRAWTYCIIFHYYASQISAHPPHIYELNKTYNMVKLKSCVSADIIQQLSIIQTAKDHKP